MKGFNTTNIKFVKNIINYVQQQRPPNSPRQSMLGVPSSQEQGRMRLSPSIHSQQQQQQQQQHITGYYRTDMSDRERERTPQEKAMQVPKWFIFMTLIFRCFYTTSGKIDLCLIYKHIYNL